MTYVVILIPRLWGLPIHLLQCCFCFSAGGGGGGGCWSLLVYFFPLCSITISVTSNALIFHVLITASS